MITVRDSDRSGSQNTEGAKLHAAASAPARWGAAPAPAGPEAAPRHAAGRALGLPQDFPSHAGRGTPPGMVAATGLA